MFETAPDAVQRLCVPACLPAGRTRHLPSRRFASAVAHRRSRRPFVRLLRLLEPAVCRPPDPVDHGELVRGPSVLGDQAGGFHHRGNRWQSRGARSLQVRQLHLRQPSLPVRAALLALQSCATTRHFVLHLSSHHVSGRSAAREGAGLFARPLCALYLVLPAGDRRTAGALVGGHASIRPAGLHTRLAEAVRRWRHLHRDRSDREDLARRSARTRARSDLCAGDTGASHWRKFMAGARLRLPGTVRFRRLLGYRDRSRPALWRPTALQLQRANAIHKPAGLLATLAYDADVVPARLRLPPAVPCRDRAQAPPAGPTLLRHGDHDGAVRSLARPKLDICGVGHAARLRAGSRLAMAPPRTTAAVPARLGDDGRLRTSDLRDLPCGLDTGRHEHLSRTCRAARSRAYHPRRADYRFGTVRLPAAGEPGHRHAIYRTAQEWHCRRAWARGDRDPGRAWGPRRL